MAPATRTPPFGSPSSAASMLATDPSNGRSHGPDDSTHGQSYRSDHSSGGQSHGPDESATRAQAKDEEGEQEGLAAPGTPPPVGESPMTNGVSHFREEPDEARGAGSETGNDVPEGVRLEEGVPSSRANESAGSRTLEGRRRLPAKVSDGGGARDTAEPWRDQGRGVAGAAPRVADVTSARGDTGLPLREQQEQQAAQQGRGRAGGQGIKGVGVDARGFGSSSSSGDEGGSRVSGARREPSLASGWRGSGPGKRRGAAAQWTTAFREMMKKRAIIAGTLGCQNAVDCPCKREVVARMCAFSICHAVVLTNDILPFSALTCCFIGSSAVCFVTAMKAFLSSAPSVACFKTIEIAHDPYATLSVPAVVVLPSFGCVVSRRVVSASLRSLQQISRLSVHPPLVVGPLWHVRLHWKRSKTLVELFNGPKTRFGFRCKGKI
jgi:hypothetical protein